MTSSITIADSSKSRLYLYNELKVKEIYSASAPIDVTAPAANVHKVPSEVKPLEPQTSAPFYFFSLKENQAPPFTPPKIKAEPKLLIGKIMNEDEAIEMIGAVESNRVRGLKIFMDEFLLRKKILVNYNLSEKAFLTSLISEVINHAASRDFNAFKLSTLITIYLDAHIFFKSSFWTSPTELWEYFKEIMIRHTIEDTPYGEEVFQPDECYDIITQFHTLYLSNLPLVHILTFGVYRLKFNWPFKMSNK